MSLTATDRLDRWGETKKITGEDAKPSIGQMRRRSAGLPAPVEPASSDAVDLALASDSIEAGVPAPLPVTAPDTPAADLRGQLAGIAARLDTIGTSVEFTEAYVSAGITKSIADMLAKELAMAERLGALGARHRRQQRFLLLVIVALVGLIVAEVQFTFLGDFSADAFAVAKQWTEVGVQWGNVAVEQVRSWWSQL
jgi:hypothetical protein